MPPASAVLKLMKRFIDILIASVTLILLSPVLLAVAAAVRLYDGGPVFFRQVRVGQGGREFGMLKFRSMVVDAALCGGFATADGDPRITRIGRFIRRTSLDELPQLLNVLVGDMSVVGPRPDVPLQRSLYEASEWSRRHAVRPGITGLAQATLRSDATPEQRKAMDLEYAGQASVLLDMKIILLTFRQVFGRGGN
jgi:lipopolysaccharide/colanic/teichoic acid biosynthesis glycosyltransferase